ncbi:hypothetical protein [Tessaracoccus sp.]
MTDPNVDLYEDLKNRWAPSPTQVETAEQALAGSDLEYVYTLHLLLDKQFSFWSTSVTVQHLPGLWQSRSEALGALVGAAEDHFARTGQGVIGGWTCHSAGGQWAVFEDIAAIRPKEKPADLEGETP